MTELAGLAHSLSAVTVLFLLQQANHSLISLEASLLSIEPLF